MSDFSESSKSNEDSSSNATIDDSSKKSDVPKNNAYNDRSLENDNTVKDKSIDQDDNKNIDEAESKPKESIPGSSCDIDFTDGSSESALQAGEVNRQLIGEGAIAYWLFQPKEVPNTPAPVTFFMHGWQAIDPHFYGGWIDHLVSNGAIVVYPVFQLTKDDTPDAMRQSAVKALQNAVAYLNLEANGLKADWDRLSIVGHSFGGGLASLVASDANDAGLVNPRFVLALAPGWRGGDLPAQDLADIPATTNMLMIEGADDKLSESRHGGTIYWATTQVQRENKQLLLLEAGNGSVVNHSSPLSPLEVYRDPRLTPEEVCRQKEAIKVFNKLTRQDPGTIDFVDHNGYWRILDQANLALDRGESPFSILPTVLGPITGNGTLLSPSRAVVKP